MEVRDDLAKHQRSRRWRGAWRACAWSEYLVNPVLHMVTELRVRWD